MSVPPKPKRMSEKRYRELYDSDPQYVEVPGARFKVAGRVSAEAVANSYRQQGIEPTIRPADDAPTAPPAGKLSGCGQFLDTPAREAPAHPGDVTVEAHQISGR